MALTPEKTTEAPKKDIAVTPEATPSLGNIPYLKWESSGVKVSPLKKARALAKKVALAPIAKPAKWLTDLAPEEVRRDNLALTYAARGYTSQATEETLKQLEPESSEAKYWQNLKATYKTEQPPLTGLFEHYYEWNRLGKVITKTETLGTSSIARGVSFGRFKNFASLRTAFWRTFKGTKIGGSLSKRAGGLMKMLPKAAKFAGPVGAGVMAWETFKKAGKVALAAIGMIFMWLAHFGTLAVLGGLGGLLIGIPLGIKAGLMTFGALAPLLGPLAPLAAIPAVLVGLATWVGTTAVGGLIGMAAQSLFDKIGAALGKTSLPQAGASFMQSAGAGAVTTAKVLAPAAVTTSIVGGAVVWHVASTAFVIPSEGEMLVSRHIRVVKLAEFSGIIGDPIHYTIQVTAIDKDLNNVFIVDHAEASCRGTPPNLDEHSWNGNISIPSGETWEETYTVVTNDQFNDCFISNTVRVTANIEGVQEESFAIANVSIGQPPEVIPWGLPIHDNPQRGSGYTYGQLVPCYDDPSQSCSHWAIDVHGPPGATVYSTFTGESVVVSIGYAARAGNYIILVAGNYQILMSHLAERPNFSLYDRVGPQAPIGIQGDTGHAFGEHVHYAIWENGIVVDPRDFGVPSPPW